VCLIAKKEPWLGRGSGTCPTALRDNSTAEPIRIAFCSGSVTRTDGPTDRHLFACSRISHSVRHSVGPPRSPMMRRRAACQRSPEFPHKIPSHSTPSPGVPGHSREIGRGSRDQSMTSTGPRSRASVCFRSDLETEGVRRTGICHSRSIWVKIDHDKACRS